MSVISNQDIGCLQDSLMELESKVLIIAETLKKITKRLEKLEKIAYDKGLLDELDEGETCVIM